MYSNSYSFYNNVYMANEKNKKDIFIAIVLGFVTIFVTGTRTIETIFSENFIISLTIFILLSYICVKAYREYKYLAILMFLSIFLLSPNVFSSREGELFPITYIIFAIYFSINLGRHMYKRWKSSY
tara:strand:+ start:1078 stop:1455 length:378 start_codon:yes stop_codon:yes gene_type:complete